MDESTGQNVTTKLRSRISNPMAILGDAVKAMPLLNKTIADSGVPARTLALAHLRTSQINGCAMCIDIHLQQFKQDSHGETLERLIAVSAWRESPLFSDAERAALALAEDMTRLADRSDAVPDAVWDEVARHYDEKAIGGLVLHIALVNLWNRFNVTTRQIPGTRKW